MSRTRGSRSTERRVSAASADVDVSVMSSPKQCREYSRSGSAPQQRLHAGRQSAGRYPRPMQPPFGGAWLGRRRCRHRRRGGVAELRSILHQLAQLAKRFEHVAHGRVHAAQLGQKLVDIGPQAILQHLHLAAIGQRAGAGHPDVDLLARREQKVDLDAPLGGGGGRQRLQPFELAKSAGVQIGDGVAELQRVGGGAGGIRGGAGSAAAASAAAAAAIAGDARGGRAQRRCRRRGYGQGAVGVGGGRAAGEHDFAQALLHDGDALLHGLVTRARQRRLVGVVGRREGGVESLLVGGGSASGRCRRLAGKRLHLGGVGGGAHFGEAARQLLLNERLGAHTVMMGAAVAVGRRVRQRGGLVGPSRAARRTRLVFLVAFGAAFRFAGGGQCGGLAGSAPIAASYASRASAAAASSASSRASTTDARADSSFPGGCTVPCRNAVEYRRGSPARVGVVVELPLLGSRPDRSLSVLARAALISCWVDRGVRGGSPDPVLNRRTVSAAAPPRPAFRCTTRVRQGDRYDLAGKGTSPEGLTGWRARGEKKAQHEGAEALQSIHENACVMSLFLCTAIHRAMDVEAHREPRLRERGCRPILAGIATPMPTERRCPLSSTRRGMTLHSPTRDVSPHKGNTSFMGQLRLETCDVLPPWACDSAQSTPSAGSLDADARLVRCRGMVQDVGPTQYLRGAGDEAWLEQTPVVLVPVPGEGERERRLVDRGRQAETAANGHALTNGASAASRALSEVVACFPGTDDWVRSLNDIVEAVGVLSSPTAEPDEHATETDGLMDVWARLPCIHVRHWRVCVRRGRVPVHRRLCVSGAQGPGADAAAKRPAAGALPPADAVVLERVAAGQPVLAASVAAAVDAADRGAAHGSLADARLAGAGAALRRPGGVGDGVECARMDATQRLRYQPAGEGTAAAAAWHARGAGRDDARGGRRAAERSRRS
eukprot:ctg_69.g62